MRKAGTGHKAQGTRKNLISLFVVIPFLFLTLCLAPCALCQDRWPGVDETVVEKYAAQHGREARDPLINTDQGDLLLFVFLLAGTIGGFAAGYYWRMLTEGKDTGKKAEETARTL